MRIAKCKKCHATAKQLTSRTQANPNRSFLKCEGCNQFLSWLDEADAKPGKVYWVEAEAGTEQAQAGTPPAAPHAGAPSTPQAPGPSADLERQHSGQKRPHEGGQDGTAGPSSPVRPRRLEVEFSSPQGSQGSQGPDPSWGPRSPLTPDGTDAAKVHVLLGHGLYQVKPGKLSLFAVTSKYDEGWKDVVKALPFAQAQQKWDPDAKVWVFNPTAQRLILETFKDKGYSLYNRDGTVDVYPLAPPDKEGWSRVIAIGRKQNQLGDMVFYMETHGYIKHVVDMLNQWFTAAEHGKRYHDEGEHKYHTFDLTAEQSVRQLLVENGYTLRCFDNSIPEAAGPPPQTQEAT